MEGNIKPLTHIHEFYTSGNYYKCKICGKTILKFVENAEGKKVGIRKDGKKLTKKTNKDRFFFPDEWMKFEDKLKLNAKHSCKCLLNTGARIMEMTKCQVKDFIYNPQGRSRLILRHTKSKARKGEFKITGGRTRDLPISKQFSKYLHRIIKEYDLQPDDTFQILTKASMNITMKRVAKKVGMDNCEDFSPHTLRKTLEVWLLALGIDSLRILAHFGHSMSTAASSYVSPDIFSWEDKKKIREIIGDLYEN